jgi:hypothetical protein
MTRLLHRIPLAVALAGALLLVGAGGVSSVRAGEAQAEIVVETRDWVFVVPEWVYASRESVTAFAIHVQNCTDLVRAWVGHRPRPGVKFVQRWVLTTGPQGSGATAEGVTHWAHAGAGVPALAPQCRGPHEVTHVLASETFGGPPILVEGIAQFSDRVFTPGDQFSCDGTGYVWDGRRYAYTDLRDWRVTVEHYNTAACLWYEVRARGGDAAIRRVLASDRADRPTTTGDLLVRNVNPALAADLTEVFGLYGFTGAELTSAAPPRAPAPPACPAGATADGEVAVASAVGGRLQGTAGRDFLCGGAARDVIVARGGKDRIVGLGGSDVLLGGAGNDVVDARDRRCDVVDGGPGKDAARVDAADVVKRVERVRR